MSQVQLYAKQQGTETYVALDLHTEEPIKLNLSVQNIEDPLAANSIFSRTFKVPNTSVNAPFFKAVFNVNSVDFDASQKADAYINDNGMFFSNGNIRLNSVYRNERDDNVEYEITFYGETSDFGSKIGGGFLNEIDFNAYNHDKTWNNVYNSWTNGLFNGDVVYGLIEWGYTYNANNQPIEPTLSNGFTNSFTLSQHALLLEQWKPQFRAKAIWDKIFADSGYTYDSEFLDSVLFNKMYVISENVAQSTLSASNLFEATNNQFITPVIGATEQFFAPIEVSDPGNNYSPTNSTYTAPATGVYYFSATFDSFLSEDFGPILLNTAFFATDVDTLIPVGGDPNSISGGFSVISYSFSCFLTAGQTINFSQNTNLVTGSQNEEFYITSFVLKCTQAPDILSINGIMPANVRKIDFMRSIINRFRLVFVPSREIQKHFTITPWKDWILQGDSLDWSDKLDTSKDLKITPLFYGQDRFQIYKDQEDADFLNYNYQLTYKQTVGQLNLDSTNELIKGTKIYQDQFASTPIAPIGFKEGDVNAPEFLIPHIAKDTGSTDDTATVTVITGKREPIQPKLRLVFYNGLIDAPITWYARNVQGGAGTPVANTTYPLMSEYSEWPVTITTFDLNWENEAPFWDTTINALGLGQTAFSCFNTYWKTWYDVAFDPYSRIVEANLVLDYQDILDLKFNDYVFIKDAWYFVNNITDYIAGQDTNCRVQLVKVGNSIGLTIPAVEDPNYTSVMLCTGITACDTYCCNPNTIPAPGPFQFWINGVDLATASLVFADPIGSIFASNGIYSDGFSTVDVTNGIISAYYNTSACVCEAPVYYEFEIKYSDTVCGVTGVCCGGIVQTVYGSNPVWEQNMFLYYNTALTLPVANGSYILNTAGVDVLNVEGGIGQVWSMSICDNCQCTQYYPHTVCYSASTACLSCCCEEILQVYTDNSVFSASTFVYTNNTGTSPAANGFYQLNGDIAMVDTGTPGMISAFTACSSCGEICPVLPVSIEVSVTQNVPNYTSTATLQKSTDNTNWFNVGAVTVLNTAPAYTTEVNTFTVQDNVYTRCIFTTNNVNGTMTTEVEINAIQIQSSVITTPGSITEVLAGPVTSVNTYAYRSVIAGGDETTCRVYVGGYYGTYKGSSAFPSGGVIRRLLALDVTADIDATFNTSIGFTPATGSTGIWDINKCQYGIIAAGQFEQYKSTNVTDGLTILNDDGTIYTAFNTLKGAYGAGTDNPLVRTVEIVGNTLYAAGEFQYWDQEPIANPGNNYYVTSPRMIALNAVDGSIDTSFTSLFDSATSIDIEIIKYSDNKLYVGGDFTVYGAANANSNGFARLNMDGTRDTSWTLTGSRTTNSIQFDDDGLYVYIGGNFAKFLARLNKSNGAFSAFIPGTGFNERVNELVLGSDGIYCVGNFTAFSGTSAYRVAKINYDGTINLAFNTATGLNNMARNCKLSQDESILYVTGDFTDYNGTAIGACVAINTADGTINTTFDVASGFNNITIGLFVDCALPETPTFLLDLCYSYDGPCDAYCCNNGLQTFYGNASSLLASTILYANAAGTVPVAAGFYSDGTSTAIVDYLGNIIGYSYTGNCDCGGGIPTYYPYYVALELFPALPTGNFYDATACIGGYPELLYSPIETATNGDVVKVNGLTCYTIINSATWVANSENNFITNIPYTTCDNCALDAPLDNGTYCATCCAPPSLTVWSTSPVWSTSSILYADSAGATTVPAGFYVYASIVLTTNPNGIVLNAENCLDCTPCAPVDCAAYQIRNEGSHGFFWNYVDCFNLSASGYLDPGYEIITTCIPPGAFNASGPYTIINVVYC